jgi:protoporphyrinogen IX oxidase
MVAWTLVFHILGIVGWVGGLMVITLALAQHAREESAEARAGLERLEEKILRAMVTPGAILAIASGIVLITTNPSYYLHAFWLHAKLALVVILLVLHGVLLARFRALRGGKPIPRRDFVLLHVLIALVFVSILIAALPGEVYFP